MSSANRVRKATIIISGLIAGGVCGMGVGLNWYPPVVGIVGSVMIAAITGLLVYRSRNSKPAE